MMFIEVSGHISPRPTNARRANKYNGTSNQCCCQIQNNGGVDENINVPKNKQQRQSHPAMIVSTSENGTWEGYECE